MKQNAYRLLLYFLTSWDATVYMEQKPFETPWF